LLWLSLLVTVGIALAWHRAGLRTTTASIALWLLLYGVFGESLALFALLLLLFVAVLVPVSLPTLRQEWLTRPLLDHVLRRRLPPRRAALAAFDPLAASQAQQQALHALLGERAAVLSPPAADDGAAVPDSAAAAVIAAHGSDEQRQHWLPALARREARIALAFDARWGNGEHSADRAQLTRGIWKGHDTLGLRLSFDKFGIDAGNGGNDHPGEISDYLVRVDVHDTALLPSVAPRRGSTLVLVPATLSGLRGHGSGSIQAHDVFVPLSRLVGGADGIGDGERQIATAIAADQYARLQRAHHVTAQALRRDGLLDRIDAFFDRPATTTRAQRREQQVAAALDVYGIGVLTALLRSLHTQQRLHPALNPVVASAAAALGVAVPRGDAAIEPLLWTLYPTQHAMLAAAAITPYGAALPAFDAALFGDGLREMLAHSAHAGLLALLDGRMLGGDGDRNTQRLARYRAALAMAADAWLTTRDPLLADGADHSALIDAFAQTLTLVAALQAHRDGGALRDEQALIDTFCERCCRRIDAALDRFVASQAQRRRRVMLRALLLPTGALLAGAGARQRERALAARLQAPGAIRDRLLQVLPADATGTRLEIALDAATSAQRRVIAAVRAGQLTPAPPVDLIAAATAQSVIDPSDAERLRSAYNLADDLLQARASVA